MSNHLIITCEHGGHRVPAAYADLFRGKQRVLRSHRGWDAGALPLAKTFARRLNAPLVAATVTRLLVELNRSLGHRTLFSEFTKLLDEPARQAVLDSYYHPHRNDVETMILRRTSRRHFVLHLSVHTFSPKLKGQLRRADVGLLYDPGRSLERRLCNDWRKAIRQARSDLHVRRNYPYLGNADGFTTYLRKKFSAKQYAGIEIEVNQRWIRKRPQTWQRLQCELADSLAVAWNGFEASF